MCGAEWAAQAAKEREKNLVREVRAHRRMALEAHVAELCCVMVKSSFSLTVWGCNLDCAHRRRARRAGDVDDTAAHGQLLPLPSQPGSKTGPPPALAPLSCRGVLPLVHPSSMRLRYSKDMQEQRLQTGG